MKTYTRISPGGVARLAVTTAVLLAGLMNAESNPEREARLAVGSADEAAAKDEALLREEAAAGRKNFKIESIETNRGKPPAKEVAWLGVSTEEVTEALGAQLGLKSGEGLVVVYVATDSPAARARIEKYDVLVEMGDQLLVHPAQLRKLVRTKKEGDTVNLTLYRQAMKQTVTATLARTTEGLGMWLEGPVLDEKLHVALGEAIGEGIRERMEKLKADLGRLDANKQKVELEVQRSIEQARKSLQDALRHKAHGASAFGPEAKELEALARGGVDIRKGATVVVKKNGNSVKSMVKTDDTGTYVIVANPKKRLTAHDQEGKLLFDGEIESEEQQQQVPSELWEKVKPMVQQMGTTGSGRTEPQAQSTSEKKI